MKLILTSFLLVLSAAGGFAQTVITEQALIFKPPRILYYDGSFLFVAVDYGDVKNPTTPGFFVHSKAHQRWRRIDKVSTRNGKFGKSYPDNEEDRRKMRKASVSWDFTWLKDEEYASLPLKGSDFISFPTIQLIEETDQYRLGFFESWGIESVKTILFIDRKELSAAFGTVPKKEPAKQQRPGPPLPPMPQ